MDIITKILALSKDKGMTEQDICKLLGLSNSGIYHWKKGKGEPSASQLHILSKHFNVSTDYLLGLTDNPTPPKKEYTRQDRLNAEIDKLTPKKRAEAETYIRFLKTQEEFGKAVLDGLDTALQNPLPNG